MPLITVVTVCFNADKYIEQTIKSVLDQDFQNFEYIVIDGGSTDNTVKIIRKYESKITRWVSEPDNGIAHAMNKSITLSSGYYVIFLHADDYFIDNSALSRAAPFFTSRVDIYAFDVLFKTKIKNIRRTTKKFGFLTYLKTPVMHQGVFCSIYLLKKLNGFNETCKIAMDYDFFLRAFKSKAIMEIHHDVLSVMRDTGISSRSKWPDLLKRFYEEKEIHYKNCESLPMRWLYNCYWFLYIPYRKLLRFYNERLS